MEKRKEKEEESSWFDSIFPKTDILFKNILSIFITYYVVDSLFKLLQKLNSDIGYFAVSLLILWTVLSFVFYHLTQILDLNTIKKMFKK